ncbi:MAG TPA: hypothetical protein VL094_11700 [Sphingomonadaceae bacterium]|nr:hypothetical protein [Sphingomonadaceae bacterium]
MLDPLIEPITPDLDGQGGHSITDLILRRKLKRAFNGDVKEMIYCLRLYEEHERSRINRREFRANYIRENINHEYRGLGEAAEILGIAHPYEPPEPQEPHERDWGQRYRLEEWVIDAGRERGVLSDSTLEAILYWKDDHYPQRRRTRDVWT